MISVYEDGEKFCHIKYWEHCEFAPIRKPHLGLIVSELKSPSDCDCYNHNNNFYLCQLVLACRVVTELKHSDRRFKGICFNIDLWSNVAPKFGDSSFLQVIAIKLRVLFGKS